MAYNTNWITGQSSYPYGVTPSSGGQSTVSNPGPDAFQYSGITNPNTSSNNVAAPAPAPQNNTPSAPSGPSQAELDQRVRDDINNAYSGYFSALDAQLNSIGDQRTSQEGIVNSQLTQGQNTLTGQQTAGLQDLGVESEKNIGNQAKSLQDLADNIRNQFQAGRLYLGARGAGDSSAANQYSYAIGKMGTKARGDVLSQTRGIENEINNRRFKLNTIYNTEMNNLKESANQKILEVANWFSQAQQQIQSMKAQGQLAKGQDLASLSKNALTFAQNQLLAAQQETANKRAALDQWAMNNATNINQLKGNLAAVSAYSAPGVNTPTISGAITQDASGNLTGPGVGFRNAAGQSWSDTTKYPKGTFVGNDGKTYTQYSDGSVGATQWSYGKV